MKLAHETPKTEFGDMNTADPSASATAAPREVRRAVLLLGVTITCLVAVYFTPLRLLLIEEEGRERLARWLESLGAIGPEVFVVGGSLLMAVGVPRLLFAALGGVLYGWGLGSVLALVATLLGSIVTFWFGRRFGHAYVEGRLAQRFARLRRFFGLVERNGVLGNILIRSAPVGNCFVTTLLLSVSRISLRDFVVGSAIGLAPQTFVFSLLGSGTHGNVAARWIGAAALFVATTVAYWKLRSHSRLARELRREQRGLSVSQTALEDASQPPAATQPP